MLWTRLSRSWMTSSHSIGWDAYWYKFNTLAESDVTLDASCHIHKHVNPQLKPTGWTTVGKMFDGEFIKAYGKIIQDTEQFALIYSYLMIAHYCIDWKQVLALSSVWRSLVISCSEYSKAPKSIEPLSHHNHSMNYFDGISIWLHNIHNIHALSFS